MGDGSLLPEKEVAVKMDVGSLLVNREVGVEMDVGSPLPEREAAVRMGIGSLFPEKEKKTEAGMHATDPDPRGEEVKVEGQAASLALESGGLSPEDTDLGQESATGEVVARLLRIQ